MNESKCVVDGCDGAIHYKNKGLCQKHYFRQWRYGTTDLIKFRKERIENPDGYQLLWLPDHPLAQKTGYVAEHRAVLYAAIGGGPMACELCAKSLTWKSCHADHIDSNVRNNDRSNLRPLCSKCNTHRNMPPPVCWNRTHTIEFDGVRMTPAEWARDPRVHICGHQIILRKKAGMSDFDALFSKKITHKSLEKEVRATERKNAICIEIDGVKMTAAEWSKHKDCTISVNGIVWRFKHGFSAKDSVFKPSSRSKQLKESS